MTRHVKTPAEMDRMRLAALDAMRRKREYIIGEVAWLLGTDTPSGIARRLGYANTEALERVLHRWKRSDLANALHSPASIPDDAA